MIDRDYQEHPGHTRPDLAYDKGTGWDGVNLRNCRENQHEKRSDSKACGVPPARLIIPGSDMSTAR